MRGLILEEIHQVQLVKPEHPAVLAFQRKLARHITERLDLKLHERAEERRRLEDIFHCSIHEILDIEVFAAGWQFTMQDPSCERCMHGGPDRYTPGQLVCWEGWHPGSRPRQAVHPCAAFEDRQVRNPRSAFTAFLKDLGIQYSAARWEGHRNDLKRAAGEWGFAVGREWEQRVRQYLALRYGKHFFLPHRWLIAEKKDGGQYFRELDGLEKWNEDVAFVYEIKRNTQAYDKLMGEYIPLLQLGYPHMRFVPIEINSRNCYAYGHEMEDRAIEQLPSLDDRDPRYRYQLVLLDEQEMYPQIPSEEQRSLL